MDALPGALRSELLDYYGHGSYARRAAPAIWPASMSTYQQIIVEGGRRSATAVYIKRMAALGCRTSLGLICRITESAYYYELMLGPAMLSCVEADDISMLKDLVQAAENKTTDTTRYARLMYDVSQYAAELGRAHILDYLHASELVYNPKHKFYEQELIATAAAKGHVSCVLMGLRDWRSRCAQYAMGKAADSAQYETFRLCHEWGGRITDKLLYTASQSEQSAGQKAITKYCRKWHPRDTYREEHYMGYHDN